MSKYGLPASAHQALTQMYNLGEKLKVLEAKHASTLPANQPFVVRLDGVAFSTLTKGLPRPFEWTLMQAMIETTQDLLMKFGASMAYTQSDEISLVFPAIQEKNNGKRPREVMDASEQIWLAMKKARGESNQPMEVDQPPTQSVEQDSKKEARFQVHMYNGRTDKIISTLAGYASARLNYHLGTKSYNHLDASAVATIKGGTAYFDARIVACESLKDVVDTIWWRSGFDGLRNAVGIVTRAYLIRQEMEKQNKPLIVPQHPPNVWYSKYTYPNPQGSSGLHRKIQGITHGKSVVQMLGMLEELKLSDYPEGVKVFGPDAVVPPRFLWGTFLKKEKYILENCADPRTGKPVQNTVWRTRCRTGSWNWADWTEEEREEFVSCKFWPKDEKDKGNSDDLVFWKSERVPEMDPIDLFNHE